MLKKLFIIFISLFVLAAFMGCNNSDVKPLSEEEKALIVSKEFSANAFCNAKEGESLSESELKAIISTIPSDKYESYPDTHNLPASATLYKNGEKISISLDDPKLIKIINFFNNCVYYSKCSYTQGLYPLDTLEKNITSAEFRLELTYTPYGDKEPSPYGSCTTMCDTIIITNSHSFTLIAHDLPGYEDQENKYPFKALGFYPLYSSYSLLDLFGF